MLNSVEMLIGNALQYRNLALSAAPEQAAALRNEALALMAQASSMLKPSQLAAAHH